MSSMPFIRTAKSFLEDPANLLHLTDAPRVFQIFKERLAIGLVCVNKQCLL